MRLFFLLSLLALSVLPEAARAGAVFDRVMESGTIRCGYFIAPPYLMKDPNTGVFSGLWYDMLEEIGTQLDLKIVWAEEVGLGDFITSLKTDRIDAMCVGLWINPKRVKQIDFTVPVSYQVLYALARVGDNRFDNALAVINSPDVTISYIDGEMAGHIAESDFPKAKKLSLPQLSPWSDFLINVSGGKADVTFASPDTVARFNAAHPGTLKIIPSAYPIRTFREAMAVKQGADDFRRMISHTMNFLIDNGTVERIIQKYETSPGSFLKPARAYDSP